MGAKITVTLKQVEGLGQDKDMLATIQLLGELGITPTRQVVLTLECTDEFEAETFRDEIRNLLAQRNPGIEVKIRTQIEETVFRENVTGPTPIEHAIKGFHDVVAQSGGSLESIALRSGRWDEDSH